MYYVGIDIGSTSAKMVAVDEKSQIVYHNVLPTGWNSVETAQNMHKSLLDQGMIVENMRVVATGYGRISVPYANKTVTEITCHGKGAAHLFGDDTCVIIDIGGQDTKIISLAQGHVKDFLMNDKCSAGTGRFLEIMSATLGVSLNELFQLAQAGSDISITSMCTVFAESEVISLIGKGTPKEDIAFGIVESITNKVKGQCVKLLDGNKRVYLTGGLCEVDYILASLGRKLDVEVISCPMARYAGAIGAALSAISLEK